MKKSVGFNIPNVVGYVRILLLGMCIFYDDNRFLWLFGISSSMDLIDGSIARFFNQMTRLGACLDMFTDLSVTAIIVCKIVERVPSNNLLLALFVDLMSHLMLFCNAAIKNTSHKNPKLRLLKIYYNIWVLVPLCAGTNIYYMFRYLETYKRVNVLVMLFFSIPFILRWFFSVLRFFEGIFGLSDFKTIGKKQ